jgi:ferritin-like protein
MKLIKTTFGWNIYKLEDLKEEAQRQEYIVEYYVALDTNTRRYTNPVEGKTIGEVLEKISMEVDKHAEIDDDGR